MEAGFDLREQNIAIVGLGLMGGSLALALHGACNKLLAVDHDPGTIELALANKIVDEISRSPEEILPLADIIILATPVQSILQVITRLPEWKPGGALVIDLGSTKSQICRALAQLPEPFTAVGGHPMCGKAEFTLANADAGLFCGKPFALVKLCNSSQPSIQMAQAIVQAIGGEPLWLDAETHDQWVAVTSHFPYLLANLMARITPLAATPLVSTGWQSTTRLAGSSMQMMQDILKTNDRNVLPVLDQFLGELETVRRLLAQQDFQQLEQVLTAGRNQHQQVSTRVKAKETTAR